MRQKPSNDVCHSLSQLMPNLERRTVELLQCMERRQSESATGFLDIKEAFSHWAFDFTVCASTVPQPSFPDGHNRRT